MDGYKVYISSEGDLDERFRTYQLKIKHSDIHHLMAFSSLLISDSQSMSVESAMLGTPNLRFSDFSGRISVLEELEHKYGLTKGIKTTEPQQLIENTRVLLSKDSIEEFKEHRRKMLEDKIDVTSFLTWYIEDYPESRKIMKKNPNYQHNFR